MYGVQYRCDYVYMCICIMGYVYGHIVDTIAHTYVCPSRACVHRCVRVFLFISVQVLHVRLCCGRVVEMWMCGWDYKYMYSVYVNVCMRMRAHCEFVNQRVPSGVFSWRAGTIQIRDAHTYAHTVTYVHTYAHTSHPHIHTRTHIHMHMHLDHTSTAKPHTDIKVNVKDNSRNNDNGK